MKRKLCPMGDCEGCVWFQPWDFEIFDAQGGKTGRVERREVCSIEELLKAIPKIHGAIDGCQAAANESRNYVLALATGLSRHGIDEPIKLLTKKEGQKCLPNTER